MIITEDAQQETLRNAGKRLRKILNAVAERIKSGVATEELDSYARTMIAKQGDVPSFLGYQPSGMDKEYPAALCVSINDEVVHGIPKKETVLKEGDVVSIDCGLEHEKIFVDAAYTTIVGEGDSEAKALLEANKKALRYALVFARAGAAIGDIGSAVETVANEYGYVTPPELGGHGIGGAQHEDPFIPNIGDPGAGEKLQKGQVIAIEPIFFEGESPHIKLADDGFTYKTVSGKRSAHFEHTIIVTEGTPILVTGDMW